MFSMGKKPEKPDEGQAKQPEKKSEGITTPMIESIKSLVEKHSGKGLKMEKILAMYKIKDINEMTIEQYKDCMNKLKLYEEKTIHE